MAKQQNKQNVQAADQRILLKRIIQLTQLSRNKLVIQLQKEQSMQSLGKNRKRKRKKRGEMNLLFSYG